MIPNIKSSEGKTVSWKSYTCGLRVYHVQRASGNPVRIPVQIISQRNCIQLPRFCHWEKQLRKIINGELLASDLYIIKEGTEFSGSGFNADYYDLNWLSNDNVQIVYVDNDTPTRDRIKFIDHGVGLGGERLINYFSLGYSTKRLSKNQLGSFGLGAKSSLLQGRFLYCNF
jgi:hypothetical protein